MATVVKADKEEEEVNADSLDLEKEEEGNNSVGTSTSDLPIFTLRISQVDHASSTPFPPTQAETPSSLLHLGPLHTIDHLLHTFTFWPDAWTTVGDVSQLPFLGHCHHVIVVMLK